MTGDDRLRAELQALEAGAPADLPPRPSASRPGRWLRLAAPAAVMVAAGVLIGVSLPYWLESIRPSGAPGASIASHDTPTPTTSDAPAEIEWTSFAMGVWHSVDGHTWHRAEHPSFAASRVTAVAEHGGRFVAVGATATDEGEEAAVWMGWSGCRHRCPSGPGRPTTSS